MEPTLCQIPNDWKFRDLTGQSFGLLQVVGYAGKDSRRNSMWICKCRCGVQKAVVSTSLTRGQTKSCGCQQLPHMRKGTTGIRQRDHIAFGSWAAMKGRCYRKKDKSFHDYGARGIRVCERWLHSFQNFLEDMGPKPSANYTIERINNNGHYEPGNCRWATRREQRRNTRKTRLFFFRGESKILSDWCEEFGLKVSFVQNRLKLGWSIEDALTTPTRKTSKKC